jgi:hypothetical protein
MSPEEAAADWGVLKPCASRLPAAAPGGSAALAGAGPEGLAEAEGGVVLVLVADRVLALAVAEAVAEAVALALALAVAAALAVTAATVPVAETLGAALRVAVAVALPEAVAPAEGEAPALMVGTGEVPSVLVDCALVVEEELGV